MVIEWADFKFPPINLLIVWPSKEMSEVDAKLETYKIMMGEKRIEAGRNTFKTIYGVTAGGKTMHNQLKEDIAASSALAMQVGGGHYKSLKIQPIEFIVANKLEYRVGNVVKYTCRHASKNGVEDINKAIHYLEMIKETDYGDK